MVFIAFLRAFLDRVFIALFLSCEVCFVFVFLISDDISITEQKWVKVTHLVSFIESAHLNKLAAKGSMPPAARSC
jgi:hypothetical protein